MALLAVDHQLHPVAELVGSDRVPLAVAEALPLGQVLRCDSSSSVVNVEEQLERVKEYGGKGIMKLSKQIKRKRHFRKYT